MESSEEKAFFGGPRVPGPFYQEDPQKDPYFNSLILTLILIKHRT
jgi:hypothetical protein